MAYQFSGVGARGGQGPDIGIQNYATLSDNIRGSVNAAIAENQQREDRKREQERLALQKEQQQLQLAQIKADTYETLQVPANTGIVSADSYLQKASRQLVDEQALLVNSLKNGDISTDDFAHKSAIIKSQVPQLANVKEGMVAFQDNYQSLLQANELSGANNGDRAKLWNAIQSGDMNIGPDPETGQIMITGMDGELSIPANSINRLPQPIKKAQPLGLMVKPLAESMAEMPVWDDNATTQVQSMLDNMLSSPDDNVNNNKLLAIGVDSLGLSLEEAQSLLDTDISNEEDNNGATNALEKMVEDSLVEEAEAQWHQAAQLRREKELDRIAKEISVQQKQVALDTGNIRLAQAAEQNLHAERARQHQVNQMANTQSILANLPIDDPAVLASELASFGANIVWDPKTKQFVDVSGKKPIPLGADPANAKRRAASQLNAGFGTPLKRKESPLKRVLNLFTSPLKKNGPPDPEFIKWIEKNYGKKDAKRAAKGKVWDFMKTEYDAIQKANKAAEWNPSMGAPDIGAPSNNSNSSNWAYQEGVAPPPHIQELANQEPYTQKFDSKTGKWSRIDNPRRAEIEAAKKAVKHHNENYVYRIGDTSLAEMDEIAKYRGRMGDMRSSNPRPSSQPASGPSQEELWANLNETNRQIEAENQRRAQRKAEYNAKYNKQEKPQNYSWQNTGHQSSGNYYNSAQSAPAQTYQYGSAKESNKNPYANRNITTQYTGQRLGKTDSDGRIVDQYTGQSIKGKASNSHTGYGYKVNSEGYVVDQYTGVRTGKKIANGRIVDQYTNQ